VRVNGKETKREEERQTRKAVDSTLDEVQTVCVRKMNNIHSET